MLTRLVLITAAVMATSSAAHAGVVQKVKFKGTQTASFFDGSATIDCGGEVQGEFIVNGFISASDSVTKTKGTGKSVVNGVFFSGSFFNTCTGEFRFLDGGASNIVDPPKRNLKSASIDGSFLAQDFNDGAVFPVDLDLEFEGVGEISRFKDVSHTKTQDTPDGPVTITHNVSGNANRSATMTGTITINGIALTTINSQNFFNWNANSNLVIER